MKKPILNKSRLRDFIESLDSESSENKEFVLCEKDEEKLMKKASFKFVSLENALLKLKKLAETLENLYLKEKQ